MLAGDQFGDQRPGALAGAAELEHVQAVVVGLDHGRQRATFAQRRDVAGGGDGAQGHGRQDSGRQRTGGGIIGAIRKAVTLTDKQDQWIKAQIEAGRFTNDSEYIRDLIRRDQEGKFRALKAAVEAGLASGSSRRTVPGIMREIEARLKADGVL